jgi:hypothetical protein
MSSITIRDTFLGGPAPVMPTACPDCKAVPPVWRVSQAISTAPPARFAKGVVMRCGRCGLERFYGEGSIAALEERR